MLHNFMDITERDGLGKIKPHQALISMDLIKISIKNNISFGKGSKSNRENPQFIELTVYNNMLVWELKVEIANIFGIEP